MAEELGIKPKRLESYEVGRVPIPYFVAQNFCYIFDVSQYWLAEGIGQAHPSIPFSQKIEGQICSDLLFSEAFSLYLFPSLSPQARKLFKLGSHLGIRVKFAAPVGFSREERRKWMLEQEVHSAMNALPIELRADFCHEVLTASDHFFEKRRLKHKRLGLIRPRDWPKNRPVPMTFMDSPIVTRKLAHDDLENHLTDSTSSKILPGEVKAQLPSLLERLNRATKETGKMSVLANFLKVPLASVSRWLSGIREPRGEITLKLLYWVEEQERQK